MQQPQQCWDYSFYTSFGWLKFAYVTNPVLPETRHVTYILHSVLPALQTQDTFTLILNFEVGHFACHFLLLSFGIAMKGIQSSQLCYHISFLSFIRLTTCFLSSWGWLLDSCKRRLFCLHIQHATHRPFEQRTPVGSSEAAVCGFCFSISLQIDLM